MSEIIRAVSWGGGTQSTAMLLMMQHEEIKPAATDAIFADTGHEPRSVYAWVELMKTVLKLRIYHVSAGDLLATQTRVRRSGRSGMLYMDGKIPAFTVSPGGKFGLLGRRCTRDFKITPITRKLRELAGGTKGIKAGNKVELAIGISYDEWHRMKPNREEWITNYWPLVDAKITRQDCLAWMRDHGYPEPPRSACYFCPFHSDAEWIRLRNEGELDRAIEAERKINEALHQQEAISATGIFLHASRIPLDQVKFREEPGYQQLSLFGSECSGMCGV